MNEYRVPELNVQNGVLKVTGPPLTSLCPIRCLAGLWRFTNAPVNLPTGLVAFFIHLFPWSGGPACQARSTI